MKKNTSPASSASGQPPEKAPRRRKLDAQQIIGLILFASLLFSIVFTILRYINAPETRPEGTKALKSKAITSLCWFNAAWA